MLIIMTMEREKKKTKKEKKNTDWSVGSVFQLSSYMNIHTWQRRPIRRKVKFSPI